MAIIRSFIPAVLALSLTVFIPQAAFAKGPCDNQSAKQQIKFEKHQLDEQKRIVEQQYRGPGNEFARRNALAQIEQQRHALDAQKRALKDQQKACKQDSKYYK